MSETIEVSVVGGSGYVGGELLRLLLFHPQVSVRQVTSARLSGRFVYTAHPTLRGTTSLQFTHPDALDRADVLFLALPHGEAAEAIDMFADKAERIIDCSADFRLRDTESYEQWNGTPHPAPEWLPRFVYGLPERNRAAIADSRFVSGVGCNATVTTLALAPLVDGGLLDHAVADIKVGSSEAGAKASPSSHHPERSGSVRSFKPTGHRHQAEVIQELGRGFRLDFSVTSVELVRGALVTAHCFLKESTYERDLWALYSKH